ncbi:unnamed protein product, partial [marine sediment metagenome]
VIDHPPRLNAADPAGDSLNENACVFVKKYAHYLSVVSCPLSVVFFLESVK